MHMYLRRISKREEQLENIDHTPHQAPYCSDYIAVATSGKPGKFASHPIEKEVVQDIKQSEKPFAERTIRQTILQTIIRRYDP